MTQFPAHDPTTPDTQAAPPVQLQIDILPGGGSLAGRQMVFTEGPVKFGRDTSNTLLLDQPTLSRFHGELDRTPEGQWQLTNFAANGTKLGKVNVGDMPVPITRAVEIKSGGLALFRVTPFTPAVQQGVDEMGQPIMAAPQAVAMGGTGNRKRMTIYIGIGLWFLLIAGIAVFFSTLDKASDGPSSTYIRLTAEQVRSEILAPPAANDQNTDAARRLLNEANDHYDTMVENNDLRAASDALADYKLAISYRPNGEWNDGEGLTYMKYTTVRNSLANEIPELYEQAADLLDSSQYARAIPLLEELKRRYPVGTSQSEISSSVQNMLNLARSHVDD